MKRFFAILLLCTAFIEAGAQEKLSFSYNTKADLVSCFIWRGMYNGGLSFQPDLSIGWESDHTSFSFGTWWNAGASDWKFTSGLPVTEAGNPNTYFIPEVDLYGMLNLWGAIVGFTHYYYFDGNSYFNFGDVTKVQGTAQTEFTFGYDFSTLFPDVDLQFTWNTMVSGADAVIDGKRAYSTYIEASYSHHFNYDISLTGVFGFSPWMSLYTDFDDENYPQNFAVNNLTLRVDKSWSFCNDSCELDLFLQGTMNTCNINKNNAFINASGDDKLLNQKLMGAIGLSFSFGGTK